MTIDGPDPGPDRRDEERRGGWLAIAVVAGILLPFVILGLVAFVAGGGDDARPGARDGVPPVGAGLEVIGASLRDDDGITSRGCRGRAPAGRAVACTLLQTELPGRRVVVRASGELRAWAVRGAEGELALQVLRRRSGEVLPVAGSRTEMVPDTGPHRFRTALAVEAGDVLALAVAPGARIGWRPVSGATVARWTGPVGEAERGVVTPGEELQLRVEIDAGAA